MTGNIWSENEGNEPWAYLKKSLVAEVKINANYPKP